MKTFASSEEGLESVVRAARRTGHQVEMLTYVKGPKRGREFLRRDVLIDGNRYRIHVLRNCHCQRGRRVRYARGLLYRSVLSAVQGLIFCMASARGFEKFIVPSDDLRPFFRRNRRTRNFYINLNGTPGVVFDFWKYHNAWPS